MIPHVRDGNMWLLIYIYYNFHIAFLIYNFLHFLIFLTAKLVFEVTHSRNYHYKPFLLTKLNAVLIANGSTRLDKS